MINTLFLDLYELTMAASYFKYKRSSVATFDLFIRKKQKERSYFVFAGLNAALDYLLNLKFTKEDIIYLRNLRLFSAEFLEYLRKFKFTADVWAMPEGTVFFPEEPVIVVKGPIIEAQIIESALLNIINLHTTMATKAARVVYSAGGRPIYDFSLRRTQGYDAGLQSSRCSYMAGCSGTSNVLAGKLYNIPVVGTMAHSFIMSFLNELASFRAFENTFPKNTILLIDTYNKMQGLNNAIRVAKEMEKRGNRLIGIRLDSGDLVNDSKNMRIILDNKGLEYVKILTSGDLDEYKIKNLLEKGAKINSFGVGTHMGTSSDMPYSDVIYKISSVTDKEGRFLATMKLSEGKITFPGIKQVFRRYDKKGRFKEDILAVAGEAIRNASQLIIKVMENGKLLNRLPSIRNVRRYCLKSVSKLPEKYKRIIDAKRYPVIKSPGLISLTKKIKKQIKNRLKTPDIPPVVFMDIDTQYDFISKEGKLSVPGAEEIVNNLSRINAFAKRKNIFVIASKDKHTRNDPEFKKFPPHCINGTRGHEKIPQTKIRDSVTVSYKKKCSAQILKNKIKNVSCVILEKNKLSIFSNPNTIPLLQNVVCVYLYGVATEYCIRHAALGLRKRGIEVVVIEDAIKAVDIKAHSRTIKELKELGVKFITTKELMEKGELCLI